MGRHHKSKNSLKRSKKHKKRREKKREKHQKHESDRERRQKRLEKKIDYLREISIKFEEGDDMKEISQSILDLHSMLDTYRDSISYLQCNESRLLNLASHELDIAEKLDSVKSKADFVYIFATDYMKKNLPAMTRELGNLIDECEDYVEAKERDHFMYYVPFLNKYLYEKEKGEFVDAIRQIEELYVNNIRMILDLYEEIKNVIQELDNYYGIENCYCPC